MIFLFILSNWEGGWVGRDPNWKIPISLFVCCIFKPSFSHQYNSSPKPTISCVLQLDCEAEREWPVFIYSIVITFASLLLMVLLYKMLAGMPCSPMSNLTSPVQAVAGKCSPSPLWIHSLAQVGNISPFIFPIISPICLRFFLK